MPRLSTPRRTLARAATCAAGLLAGCAATPHYTERLQALVGQPVEAAIAAWGDDFERRPADADGFVYAWAFAETWLAPGHREPPTVAVGPNAAPVYAPGRRGPPVLARHTCRVEVDTDRDGRIHAWRSEGAGCDAALAPSLRPG